MINYVFVFFLPGAAGNFFSRCLSLSSDQACGWIPNNSSNPMLSAEEKFRAYSYSSSSQFNDWKDFEGQLVKHHTIFDHFNLPRDSVSIWSDHPGYIRVEGLAGTEDKQYRFYINPGDNFEWVMLNSLYKNSSMTVEFLKKGHLMSQNPNVNQISLANIIAGPETLWLEIQKVYAILEKECSNKELITALWQQWHSTTLKPEQFTSFKRSTGFRL